MSDLIVTQLGRLSAVAAGYPVKSKSSGAHTLTATVTGTGAVSFTGALMGSNDGESWVTVASLSASGTNVAVATSQVSSDYAFWRFDAGALSGTGALVSGVLSTDASAPEAGDVVRFVDGRLLAGSDVAVIGLPAGAIRGYRTENYARSRLAMMKARAGAPNMKLVRLGNSTELGRGVSASGYDNAALIGPAARFAKNCQDMGLGVFSTQSTFGSASASFATLDPRLTVGAGWSTTGAYGLGGGVWLNATTTNGMVFAPTSAVTHFVVHYIDAGTGQFTLQIGGGSTITITCANTAVHKTTTVSAAAGTSALTIARVSGSIYIVGIAAYHSLIGEVSVYSSGWAGGKLADYVGTGTYTLSKHLKVIAPDLTIIRGSINDWVSATSVSAFKASLSNLIEDAKISGDAVLSSELPTQATTTPLATQRAYVEAMREVGEANGVALIDGHAVIGSWESAGGTTSGEYDDDKHGARLGYERLALLEARFVALVAAG